MKFLMAGVFFSLLGLPAQVRASSDMEAKGCILISKGKYTCPKEGCSIPFNSGATSKKEFLCNPLEVKGLTGNIYDELGPFRYIYDEKLYADLVKAGQATRSEVANKNVASVNPAKAEYAEFYAKEAYSADVFQNKIAEIAAVIWSTSEFKKQCRILEGNADQLSEWYRPNAEIVQIYKDINKELKIAQLALQKKASLNKNSQLAPLYLQVDSIKLSTRYLNQEFGFKNYHTIIARLRVAQQVALQNSQVFDKNMRKLFIMDLVQEALESAKTQIASLCNSGNKDCGKMGKGINEIEASLNEYAKIYETQKIASDEINKKLEDIEISMLKKLDALPTNNKADWRKSLFVALEDMASLRKKSGLICPKDMGPYTESAKNFATDVGIEVNEKNAANFKLIWDESENYMGQPYQRIGYFNRVGQFLDQVDQWKTKSINENGRTITKLMEVIKTTRKSLGLSEYETIDEAKLRTSAYILNHPEFVKLGQYPTTGIWYAQLKDKKGNFYSLEISDEGPDVAKDLCYGIIKGGCKAI